MRALYKPVHKYAPSNFGLVRIRSCAFLSDHFRAHQHHPHGPTPRYVMRVEPQEASVRDSVPAADAEVEDKDQSSALQEQPSTPLPPPPTSPELESLPPPVPAVAPKPRKGPTPPGAATAYTAPPPSSTLETWLAVRLHDRPFAERLACLEIHGSAPAENVGRREESSSPNCTW